METITRKQLDNMFAKFITSKEDIKNKLNSEYYMPCCGGAILKPQYEMRKGLIFDLKNNKFIK